MTALNALLPMLSVLLGSGITYWFNVRTRRRGKVEDVYHEAIAAVAVAMASTDYMSQVNWGGASEKDRGRLAAELGREAAAHHVRAVSEARAAVARASAYDPALSQYFRADVQAVYKDGDEIIGKLRSLL